CKRGPARVPGPIWCGCGTGGGGIPPAWGAWVLSRAGDPDRPQLGRFILEFKGLEKIRRGVAGLPLRATRTLFLRFQCDPARLGFVPALGAAETRPKPLRNAGQSPRKSC